MIANPKPVDYKEDEYLRYFPDGRKGVQKRLEMLSGKK